MNPESNLEETMWSCYECDSWWMSQALSQPNSWRVFRMPSVDALMFEVGKCPEWLMIGSDPSICLECGATLDQHQSKMQNSAHLTTLQN